MEYTRFIDVKKEQQNRFDAIIKESGMFFAFSDQQMEEGKKNCPLESGDEYVRSYAGGVLPRSKSKAFNIASDNLQVWVEETIKENNLKEQHILYELDNHEAFYTYDITNSMMSLPYTEEEVSEVFHKNKNKYEY
jgi:hypothetical protein